MGGSIKPIVYKQDMVWYTLHRNREGKLHVTASHSWGWAIIEALTYAHMNTEFTRKD